MSPDQYMNYVEAVNGELERLYAITVMDSGIDWDDIAKAHDEGWTPKRFAKWHGQRFGLTERKDVGL